MERQSTSKLYRALIAVVAFFVLCTSAILFASCGTDPRECKHEHLDDSDVVAVELATCGTPGTVTYECSDCGAEVTQIGTLATGEHTWANGKCTVCGVAEGSQGLTLKQVQDALATLTTKVDEQASVFVQALQDPKVTIPALDKKLETILASVQDFGDLDIEGFDASEFEFLAETGTTGKVTLTDVITALYKQVHQLYVDYASTAKDANLYDLLVSTDGSHVHTWVLQVKGDIKDCSKGVTYEWGCAFCDAKKEGEVTVKAIGHATDYKYGLDEKGNPTTEAKNGHYVAATCIAPARVEGHCAVCGQWTGEWNPVGEPTYKHNYVLEANHTVGSKCTQVGQKVYHCATCGGAYVEEVAAPGHQYYYKLNANGEKEALSDAEKKQIVKDYYGYTTDAQYEKLTEDQKGYALQPYLNVVYSADATCVDPGLVVVECLECGVRYSYTTNQAPTGHKFVSHAQESNTCVDDGTAGYAYCSQCGYFFFCGLEGENVTTAQYLNPDTGIAAGESSIAKDSRVGGWYSRNYIRKDGKVIHYLAGKGETLPEAVNPNSGEDAAKAPQALRDLWEVISAELPAKGHDLVPVYINTESCVTAQKYILVCKAEGCFDGLEDLLKVEENGKFVAYKIKGLTGDNADDEAAGGVVEKQLKDIVTAMKWDNEEGDPDEDGVKPVIKSALTLDWEAVSGTNATVDKLVEFFMNHRGYLNRDAADPQTFSLGGSKDDDENLKSELAALGKDGLLALYAPYNVLVTRTATSDGVVYNPVTRTDLVDGHIFTDKVTIVEGGCTLYERHQFFCTLCGSEGVERDENNKGIATIEEVIKDEDAVDDAKYNDLLKEWNAIKESENWSRIFLWLAKHGYLNDFRDGYGAVAEEDVYNDEGEVEARSELTDVQTRFAMIVLGKNFGDVLGGGIGTPEDVEALCKYFTGTNVLAEFTVKVNFLKTDVWAAMEKYMESDYEETAGGFVIDPVTTMPTLPAIELGHKFDTIVYTGDGKEACDAPASYVYVCSACGVANVKDNTNDFGFANGSDEVKVEAVKAVKNATEAGVLSYKADSDVLKASVPTGTTATGEAYEKSDLELEWVAQSGEDAQFAWLLKKGYLNGVIDSVMLYGYEDAEDNHVKGELEKAVEAAADEETTLQELFDEVYEKFYNVTYAKAEVKADADKGIEYSPAIPASRTVKTAEEMGEAIFGEVKAAAEALALKADYGTTTADFTKFYTQSGDGVDAEGEDLEVAGKAANKTSEAAATTIPMSGHLWLDGTGKPVDVREGGDGLCTGFKSQTLTDYLDAGNTNNNAPHYYAEWVPAAKDPETGEITEAAHWKKGGAILAETWTAFKATDAGKAFIEAAAKYGVIAACRRGAGCPLHTNKGATATMAFGYYVASDHVVSYEKFAASDDKLPSDKVEIFAGKHVYYNVNQKEAYATADLAGKQLAGFTGNNQEALWTKLLADKAANLKGANEKYEAALLAARRADLHNLYTLQEIWNTLFVSRSYLYPVDKDGKIIWTAGIDKDGKATRGAIANLEAYPFYDVTSIIKPERTEKVKVNAVEKEYPVYGELTAAQFAAIKELFAADSEVALLWTGDAVTNITSAWRPLNDSNEPSCWVDSRCKWYHYNGGIKCGSGSPERKHTHPVNQYVFGYETHLANCVHADYCVTCGWEIGTLGNHNLIVTLSEDETNETYQTAWLEILKAAYNDNKALTAAKSTDTDAVKSRYYFLQAVKEAITFEKGFTWESGWTIKKDTCYDNGETADNKKEDVGYTIKICSGELEKIAKNVALGRTWDTGITWAFTGYSSAVNTKTDVASDTITKEPAGGANCHVDYIDSAVHGWDLKEPNYIRYYYYLGNYTLANGTVIGEKDGQIYVDLVTKEIVAEGSPNAEALTQQLIDGEFEGFNPLDFNVVNCTAGWYTKDICQNEKAAGGICGCVNPATDGSQESADKEYRHKSNGHHYAPVENYWLKVSEDPSEPGYKAPTNTQNAYVWQVCTVCGLNMQGIYGDNIGGDGRPQFQLATEGEVLAWNNHIEDLTGFERAQMIRTEDLKNGKPVEGTTKLSEVDGLYVYTDDGEITLATRPASGSGTNDPTKDNTIGAGKDVTFLVGKNSTLTIKPAASGADQDDEKMIYVKGTLAFVGEEGAEVDLSNLRDINVDGGQLIFKNIKVNLGANTYIYPGSGGTITFDGAEVTATTPFSMNSHNGSVSKKEGFAKDTPIKVDIKNSKFTSTGIGFAIWKDSVEVTAENSLFIGDNAGALIRSGKATFTNCWFATDSEKSLEANEWSAATTVPVNAALIVGNAPADSQQNDDFNVYGNAEVVLNGCVFQTYTEDSSAVVTAWTNVMANPEATYTDSPCTEEAPAIEAFSSEYTKTKITLDLATFKGIPAGAFAQTHATLLDEKGNDTKIDSLAVVYPTIKKASELGKEAADQAQAVADLAGKALASGGSITLPKVDADENGDPTVVKLTEAAIEAVGAGVKAEVDLGGNTVEIEPTGTTTVEVEGDLTIKNATIDVRNNAAADVATLAAEGEGSKLTLDHVVLTSDTAIGAKNGGTIKVVDSVVHSGATAGDEDAHSGYGIATNNTTSPATIEIENSTVISGYNGIVGVLINNKDDKLIAKNSTFYGTATGAWIRAGKATFESCRFISGSYMGNSDWGDGNRHPKTARAAILIGDGKGNYGDADVTINGTCTTECVIEGTDPSKDSNIPAEDATQLVRFNDGAKDTGKGVVDTSKATPIDDQIKKGEVAKPFVFASDADNDATTVTFANKNVADTFLGKDGLVKGTNMYYDEATGSKITVRYITRAAVLNPDGTVKEPAEYQVLLQDIAITEQYTADKALGDAAKSGGRIVIEPKTDGTGTNVEVSSLAVTQGRNVEVVLNEKDTLNLGSGATVPDGAGLTITGGTVTGNILAAVSEGGFSAGKAGGTVTLKDVEFNGQLGVGDGGHLVVEDCVINADRESGAGLVVSSNYTPSAEEGAVDQVIRITNTTITTGEKTDGAALFVNGKADNALLILTNCNIIGSEIGLAVMDGNVEVNGGAIYGGRIAALVRGGEVSFSDTAFIVGQVQKEDGAYQTTWGQYQNIGKGLEGALVIANNGNGYSPVKITTSNCTYAEASVGSLAPIAEQLYAKNTSGIDKQIGNSGYYYTAVIADARIKQNVVIGVTSNGSIEVDGSLGEITFVIGTSAFYYEDNSTTAKDGAAVKDFNGDENGKGKVSGAHINSAPVNP